MRPFFFGAFAYPAPSSMRMEQENEGGESDRKVGCGTDAIRHIALPEFGICSEIHPAWIGSVDRGLDQGHYEQKDRKEAHGHQRL